MLRTVLQKELSSCPKGHCVPKQKAKIEVLLVISNWCLWVGWPPVSEGHPKTSGLKAFAGCAPTAKRGAYQAYSPQSRLLDSPTPLNSLLLTAPSWHSNPATTINKTNLFLIPQSKSWEAAWGSHCPLKEAARTMPSDAKSLFSPPRG